MSGKYKDNVILDILPGRNDVSNTYRDLKTYIKDVDSSWRVELPKNHFNYRMSDVFKSKNKLTAFYDELIKYIKDKSRITYVEVNQYMDIDLDNATIRIQYADLLWQNKIILKDTLNYNALSYEACSKIHKVCKENKLESIYFHNYALNENLRAKYKLMGAHVEKIGRKLGEFCMSKESLIVACDIEVAIFRFEAHIFSELPMKFVNCGSIKENYYKPQATTYNIIDTTGIDFSTLEEFELLTGGYYIGTLIFNDAETNFNIGVYSETNINVIADEVRFNNSTININILGHYSDSFNDLCKTIKADKIKVINSVINVRTNNETVLREYLPGSIRTQREKEYVAKNIFHSIFGDKGVIEGNGNTFNLIIE